MIRAAAACCLLTLLSACTTPRAGREAVAWRQLSPAQADAIAAAIAAGTTSDASTTQQPIAA